MHREREREREPAKRKRFVAAEKEARVVAVKHLQRRKDSDTIGYERSKVILAYSEASMVKLHHQASIKNKARLLSPVEMRAQPLWGPP